MIELREIRKSYWLGTEDLPVLKGITLDIMAGEYVALMGSSGSGKTTLMNLLGSLDNATSGTYQMGGIDVSGLSADEVADFRSQHVGFVFQSFNLLARTTALDNVLLPTLYAAHDGRTQLERVEYAKHLLDIVGLADRADHTPNRLSGGECQRVAIARALINRPKLLLADEPTGNLDSNTELEILDLFRRLNQEHHITLVVVTHDAEVARQADRVIHMRDGVIADQVGNVRSRKRRSRGEENGITHPRKSAFHVAATINAIMVAILALRRNSLRTMLTMLGVIIGVASVVNVLELSNGASRAVRETVASMGASTLTITSTNQPTTGRRRRYVPLTPRDVDLVAARCPAVQLCTPLVHGQIQLIHGNRRWRPTFSFGTSSDYLKAHNWAELDMGQLFSERDVKDAARVCLIGQTVTQALFDDQYPVGQEIRVNGVPMRVVGVMSPKGGDVIGNDQDDTIVAPWTTFKYRLSSGASDPPPRVASFADKMPPMLLASSERSPRNEHLHQIYVKTHSAEQIPEAREQIRDVLSTRHDVEADVFQINDMTEVGRVTKQVVSGLSALGLLIGGVSLLVGGVGIMNIMLVSVTERTREIGLRMAVGANRRAIMRQFLIEATVLCLIGGLIGILFGHACAQIVSYFMSWPSSLSVSAPLVAVTVAATVGIVFGYYPARKASLLDPIDALRYE